MHLRIRSLVVLTGCTALAALILMGGVATLVRAEAQADTGCTGGVGWTQLSVPPASNSNIRPKDELLAVAAGWRQPGELWGGDWGGLHHSTDCGRTWVLVPVPLAGTGRPYLPRLVFALATDQHSRVFVVRTEETITMTPDDGQSWLFAIGYLARDQQRPRQLVHGRYIAASAGPDGTVYATVDERNLRGRRGLWRTTNGSDWEERHPSTYVVLAVDPRNADVLYVNVAGERFSRSTDGGLSFERYSDIRCPDPLPPDGHVQAMAISPDASRFWLVTSTNTLCRSLDEGQTWERLDDGPPGGTIKALAIDPFDNKQLYVVTEELDLWIYREPPDESASQSAPAQVPRD